MILDKIVQKTYPGDYPRPSVEILSLTDQNILVAATPWGNKNSFKEMIQGVRDFMISSHGDIETTSPFAKLPSLSPLENNLRNAALFANQLIFKKCNQESYQSAVETIMLFFNRSQVSWVQVGQPHLLLLRQGQLVPLQMAIDLSVDYRTSTPLPSRLLGVDSQLDLEVKSLTLQNDDRIVLLARSTAPGKFLSQTVKDTDSTVVCDKLFDSLVKADNKIPFWVSVLG